MIRIVSIGIGAGLVAALLFSVVTTGSPAGMILCYLAPLPILIVALGWTHLVGLLGACAGTVALSLLLRPNAGLAFAFGAALPAWGIAYVALLVRGSGGSGTEWYSAGRLLACVALAATFVTMASLVTAGGGDYAAYHDRFERLVSAFIRIQAGLPPGHPLPPVAGLDGDMIVRTLVALAPSAFAALLTIMFGANLWGAMRIVAISGRLPRPPLDVPSLRMPGAALLALAGGILLALAPGYAGMAGVAVTGAVAMAFAVQGLAFLHDVTRGRRGRGLVLFLTYVLTLTLGQALLPLLALTGMADTATSLRRSLIDRTGRGPGRPPSP